MTNKRAVCLNCIDGRVQLPVIHWIKENYPVEHVDMITEPGMDGVLADQTNSIEGINRKVSISIEANHAAMIMVVGHHDCKGYPVEDAVHQDHILSAVERIKKDFPRMDVHGLWVNTEWTVELLT